METNQSQEKLDISKEGPPQLGHLILADSREKTRISFILMN